MEKHTLDWFLSHTVPDGDCLIWTRCFNTDGYPRIAIDGHTNGKVHRIVCGLSLGIGITGLVVRHTCDNPKCINPEHLLTGSNIDNVADRHERGRTNRQVLEEDLLLVKELRSKGNTYQFIADKLGCNYKRVEYIVNKYLK